MDFLDKLTSVAKTAGEKTGNAIEITKLNAKIGKEREHINNNMREIGEIYYARIADGYELLPEAAEFAERIKESEKIIADAQEEIERIRSGEDDEEEAEPSREANGVKFCTSCGAENTAAAMFCSSCGGKF